MAKLYKTTLYILDPNGDETAFYHSEMEDMLIYVGLDDSDFLYAHYDDAVVAFEWSDDHPLNFAAVTQKDYDNIIEKHK